MYFRTSNAHTIHSITFNKIASEWDKIQKIIFSSMIESQHVGNTQNWNTDTQWSTFAHIRIDCFRTKFLFSIFSFFLFKFIYVFWFLVILFCVNIWVKIKFFFFFYPDKIGWIKSKNVILNEETIQKRDQYTFHHIHSILSILCNLNGMHQYKIYEMVE